MRLLLALSLVMLLSACGYHLRGAHFSQSSFTELNLNYVDNEAEFAELLTTELTRQGIVILNQSADTTNSMNLFHHEQSITKTSNDSYLIEAAIQVQLLRNNKTIRGTEKLHESHTLVTERTGNELDELQQQQLARLNLILTDRIRLQLEAAEDTTLGNQ